MRFHVSIYTCIKSPRLSVIAARERSINRRRIYVSVSKVSVPDKPFLPTKH